jgi:hypothetical protein
LSYLYSFCDCLLSPDGNDPIFIGINRLVAKGLNNGKQEKEPVQYPCQVVNRFQCPYEKTTINDDDAVKATNTHFNAEDLFRLFYACPLNVFTNTANLAALNCTILWVIRYPSIF